MRKLAVLLLVLLLATPAFAIDGITVLNGASALRFDMGKDMSADVGLGYSSTPIVGTTNTTTVLALFGRIENKIMKKGPINTYWGGALTLGSTAIAGASATTITITGLVGAEYFFAKNLSLFADINLLNINLNSGGGTSTTGFQLLASNAQVYTGGRLYF